MPVMRPRSLVPRREPVGQGEPIGTHHRANGAIRIFENHHNDTYSL